MKKHARLAVFIAAPILFVWVNWHAAAAEHAEVRWVVFPTIAGVYALFLCNFGFLRENPVVGFYYALGCGFLFLPAMDAAGSEDVFQCIVGFLTGVVPLLAAAGFAGAMISDKDV